MGRIARLLWLVLHFLLLLAVCWDVTLWLLGQGFTGLPSRFNSTWAKAQSVTSALLLRPLAPTHPLRQMLWGYLHGTGIEGGYGFFAPDVPNSYKLVFELHYPDGRIEYELPVVSGTAAGVRLGNLLDQIARVQYAPLRELMIKMLAYSVWQVHPDAASIRAVFGSVELPTADEFKNGGKESYVFLYAYDFRFRQVEPNRAPP